MDCSPPSSSVHGISQARILEWVAIHFSRGSSQPRDRTGFCCIGRWILYHCMTREASIKQLLPLIQCFFPGRDFPGGSVVKNLPANAGDAGSISGSERSLEKAMAIYSSILAWESPWIEEPGRLQSVRSQSGTT